MKPKLELANKGMSRTFKNTHVHKELRIHFEFMKERDNPCSVVEIVAERVPMKMYVFVSAYKTQSSHLREGAGDKHIYFVYESSPVFNHRGLSAENGMLF